MSDGLNDDLLLWSLTDRLRAVDLDDRPGLEDSLTTYAGNALLALLLAALLMVPRRQ